MQVCSSLTVNSIFIISTLCKVDGFLERFEKRMAIYYRKLWFSFADINEQTSVFVWFILDMQ